MKIFILAAACILALVPISTYAEQADTNCAVRHAFDHDGNIIGKFEYPCVGNDSGCSDCTPPSIGKSSFEPQFTVPNGLRFNFEPVPLVDYNITDWEKEIKVGELNHVTLVVYENSGTQNLELVELNLNCNVDMSSSECPVALTWQRDFEGNVTAYTKGPVTLERTFDHVYWCDNDQNSQCTFVTFAFTVDEPFDDDTKMIVKLWDLSRNSWEYQFVGGLSAK